MHEETTAITTQPLNGMDGAPPAAAHQPAPDELADSGEMEGEIDVCAKMELTLRHQKLLGALVVDPDIQAACKTADVSRSTAHRWLRHPDFRDELARQREALFTETLNSAKSHAARAMAELARLMGSKDDRLRRQVCNDIIDRAIKVRELNDLEQRLVALEKTMEDKQNRRHA